MTKFGYKRTASIGLIILTFFGIALNFLFFLPTISSATQIFLIQRSSELFFPTDPVVLVGFMVFLVLYCSFGSIILHPKQLVNPIVIQVGTFALVIISSMMNLSIGGLVVTVHALLVLGFLVIFSSAFVILIGFFQWLLVMWLIRMRYEDSDRISYTINIKPKEFVHKLGDTFLDDWGFSRKRDVGEIWVMERDEYTRRLLLEVGTDPYNNGRTVLATVAYEVVGTAFIKSVEANRKRDMILRDIEHRTGVSLSQEKKIGLDDPISKLAFMNVENLTYSRIEVTWKFLTQLSRMFKVMLSLTLVLLFGLSIVYFNFNEPIILSSDTYIGAIVVLMVALFVEIGIPLREELQKKKRDEIEC